MSAKKRKKKKSQSHGEKSHISENLESSIHTEEHADVIEPSSHHTETSNANRVHKFDFVRSIKKITMSLSKKPQVIFGGIFLALFLVCAGYGVYYYHTHQAMIAYERKLQSEQYEALMQQIEKDNVSEIMAIQERYPTDTWKKFTSQYYGFEIPYPAEGWSVSVQKIDQTQSKAIYRVNYLKHNDIFNEPVGFSVSVYDTANVKELSQTDEFPAMRVNDLSAAGLCAVPEGHMYETGDYPAEEIYIPLGDECYESTLFFTMVKGQYIYNITPIVGMAMSDDIVDPMIAVVDMTPEYFSAVSQFGAIEIVRPKPKPVLPKVAGPMPATYKKDVLGRRVCEKSKDKPSKSKENNKGKTHMDMECCLDPDEYPNPHCYYDPGKYGKYLTPEHQAKIRAK